MRNNDIHVSVVCTAYNHEKYIRDALDGFVNQKTNFNYEVIVHDDASEDNTAKIIKEYENKYPDIIKAIYQSENQYSKNVGIMDNIIFPCINGDYVAICEGDDYWIDNNKLQKQADFLDNNNSYVAVVHNSYYVDEKNNNKWVQYQCDKDENLKFENIIKDGGSCYHTSSIMFRKEYFKYPNSFKIKNIGDYPRSVFLSLVGDIYYWKECMSVHRFNVPGSWTERNISNEKQIQTIININDFLDAVDVYTGFKKHNFLNSLKRKNNARKLSLEDNYLSIISKYPDVFLKMPLGQKKHIIKESVKQLVGVYEK